MVDVLETDVDALLQISVADLLVDDDADGGFGHVVDDSGLAVVDFVCHALLLCAVVLDVYDVADSVCFPVGGGVRVVIVGGGLGSWLRGLHKGTELDHTLLSEVAREPIVDVSFVHFLDSERLVLTYA